MTESNNDNGTAPQVSEDILYTPSSGSTDRRKREVVELSIGKLEDILERVRERNKYTDTNELDPDTDSIHVVGRICDGWDARVGAEIDAETPEDKIEETIDHLPNAERGEHYVFRHWDAMPMKGYTFKNEYIAATSPKTWRNQQVSSELDEEVNRTKTDEELEGELHEALSKAQDKAEQLDRDGLEDRIKRAKQDLW